MEQEQDIVSSLIVKAIENFIRIEYHEPYLMEHPEYIPYARAAGVYFIGKYGGAGSAALFAGLFDARMTYLMGGDNTDQWHAFNRGFTSTYIASSASSWASSAGEAASSATGSAAAGYATEVVVYGTARGAVAETQGEDFWQGFASGAAQSMMAITAREMRAAMIRQSKLSIGNTGGESEGVWGDFFKLAGCRDGSEGWCIGGMQNGQGYSLQCVGGCSVLGISVPDGFKFWDYQSGGLEDRVLESFAGPHDWWSNAADAYDPGTGRGTNAAGDGVGFLMLIPSAPFAAASLMY